MSKLKLRKLKIFLDLVEKDYKIVICVRFLSSYLKKKFHDRFICFNTLLNDTLLIYVNLIFFSCLGTSGLWDGLLVPYKAIFPCPILQKRNDAVVRKRS